MSSDHVNGNDAEPDQPDSALRREIEILREQLAKARAEAEYYKRAAYAFLKQLEPYEPPTEEELQDLLHGPRGPAMLDLIAQLEREGDG
jgi:hypothetical protein